MHTNLSFKLHSTTIIADVEVSATLKLQFPQLQFKTMHVGHFSILNFLLIFKFYPLQQPSVGPCRAHGIGGSPQLNTNSVSYCWCCHSDISFRLKISSCLGSQILIFDIHKIADISDAPPTEEEIDDHIVCIENIIKRNCPGYLF